MGDALKVLCGGAMRPLLAAAVPLFERTGGIKVDVVYRLTSALQKDIESGVAFDIALMPRPELDALAQGGPINVESRTDIARSAIGVTVRAGAPKPDIGSIAAFIRAWLHAAKTVGFSDGPSGLILPDCCGRLGVAEAIKAYG